MVTLASSKASWPDLWWPAPAKLNLFLKVIGRRPDGYHQLQTVFQLLALSDWLNFTKRDDGEIRLEGNMSDIESSDNLIVRAAKLLQVSSSTSFGAEVVIKKVLPMGAGLGGGSSDAATTLVVLNELWQLHLSLDKLAEIGLSLGADVPVFVLGKSAWAEGVGEDISPMMLNERWYLVVNPGSHISTKEVFSHNRLTRDSSPITIRDFHEGQLDNDCLSVVRELDKNVDAMYQRFSIFTDVYLTGTGSSLFATCKTREDALKLSNKLPDNWTKWLVKGVNESPLHKALNRFVNQV
ncbi:MAG: 4-(cytidine 5'-diphospho)-2-C-methyl-D-erythritol kinase [Piscirickettsiaceae bacterium]|nr:MAG: 4-(cytidine 5'-diphospho)-2-C-methyl-D-erythritol kinase [Piscirickettsiaceae bacterium]